MTEQRAHPLHAGMKNWRDYARELEAERDRYRELFEAKYSTIQAERDCYREALDTIARMDNGVSVSRPFSDAPTIARAALHPEEEE